MLTRLTVSNFKRFGHKVEIELGNPVVLIGPNDSGKTTALQALALWHIGLSRWTEKRSGKARPEKRPGVAINRRDLIAMPVPDARLLWKDLSVRAVERSEKGQRTQNIRMDILVEGVSGGKDWACGLEFDYANEESIYCRPLRQAEGKSRDRMPIPNEAGDVKIAFLPPMSGLSANETRLDPGAISVRLGEGRTAEVLRNLCYQVLVGKAGDQKKWDDLRRRIKSLFGITLNEPKYIPERGEIAMTYKDALETELDLSCSGRGMQQVMLLLAYLAGNPNSVLLLDEPDAHLEVLRQRQIYQMLTETASSQNSQIIAASHSEVILNEAADRDVVVAFLGKPHRIDDRGSQLLKALKDIGYEHYFQAEETGWVLYLEGSTDLSILQTFARILEHPAGKYLEKPFVHYVENKPNKAYEHYYGLQEAKSDLVGYALFDRLESQVKDDKPGLRQHMWERREIENYLCDRNVLLRWAESIAKAEQGELFSAMWRKSMEKAIEDVESAMKTLGKESPWSGATKVSDEFLGPVFEKFFKALKLPNLMSKSNYHKLAKHLDKSEVAEEIRQVLDEIREVAEKAKPVEGAGERT